MDRIDLRIEVPAVPYRELTVDRSGEPSAAIRERVNRAREFQRERFAKRAGVFANAHMGPKDLKRFCRISDGADALLKTATRRLKLSARAYHRALKISRTIADSIPESRPPAGLGWEVTGASRLSPGGSPGVAVQYRSLEWVVRGRQSFGCRIPGMA